jgi:hypothetical protein
MEGSGRSYKVLFRHLSGGTEVNHKNLNRYRGRDLCPGPPEYESGVLKIRPRSSVQGYSKRSTHFQKIILQVLLNIWRRAIYRLKGELSTLFSHLTSTRCEPHV